MKFFTKNKIIAGVIGLIAVVGVVNTHAIISLSGYVKGERAGNTVFSGGGQEAQVSMSNNNCLRINPLGTRTSRSFDGEVENQNYKVEEYLIGASIKNICPFKVYIINPSSFWSPVATLSNPLTAGGINGVYGDIISEPAMTNNFKVGMSSFPGITVYTNPIPPQFLSHTPPGLLNESLVQEFSSAGPSDIVVSPDNLQAVGIQLGSNLQAYGLGPQTTRKFWYFVSVVHPGYLDNPSQGLSFTKVILKSIKWFRDSSINDSILTANEVRTSNISTASLRQFETSSVRIGEIGDCPEGQVIGFNKDGTPIYCN